MRLLLARLSIAAVYVQHVFAWYVHLLAFERFLVTTTINLEASTDKLYLLCLAYRSNFESQLLPTSFETIANNMASINNELSTACPLPDLFSTESTVPDTRPHDHIEHHKNHSDVLGNAIIGFADGLTVPFALTAGLSA